MKPIEIRLVGRFRFISKISQTHHHILYRGIHSQTDEPLFIKGEQCKNKSIQNFLSILQEGKVLQMMQGGSGIPHMHWCGQEEDYNFIVLEELESSIGKMLGRCNGKFSLKTGFMLGDDIISILQYFHFKNFVHNQIHPNNFMLGVGVKYDRLYIVDYSAATRFKDSQKFDHISETSDKKTELRSINLEFSSIRYHKGENVSRKDDMESLLYLLAYFLKGSLPWSEAVKNHKKPELERIKTVLKIKLETPPEIIFEGFSDLLTLFKYTQELTFEEKPRYAYYKNVFKQRIEKMGQLNDRIFDWMLLEEPELVDDPQISFQIIPNEAEFIKQIAEEMKVKQNLSQQTAQKRIAPTLQKDDKKTKDKECEIY